MLPMKILKQEDLRELVDKSRSSERKRAVHVIHLPDKIGYRIVVNSIQPDSYMRPHVHKIEGQNENWIILQGKIALILFDGDGKITESYILSSKHNRMVDIPSGIYHTAVVLEEDSIMYEISDGPYDPDNYKEFVDWAPSEEQEVEAREYLKILKRYLSNIE